MNAQKNNAVKKTVLVLGTGVSGLTAAYELLLAGHHVTLWSKELPGVPAHTSSAAYAMIVPVKDDGDNRVKGFYEISRHVFEALSSNPATGVEQRKIIKLSTHHIEPWFASEVSNYRHPYPGEIPVPADFADAQVFDTASIIDPSTYLSWLYNQVVALGGVFETRTIASFNDCPAEFDVIVNCTGLGSRKLTDDTDLYAERVQVVKIRPNGFQDVVIDDDGPHKRACIVAHNGYIKLGAVFDGHVEDLTVSDDATSDILARCNAVVPGLNATADDVIEVVRAHRPERSRTRVELVSHTDGRPLVHAYGHDGMGYILSWGIAQWIADQVGALAH